MNKKFLLSAILLFSSLGEANNFCTVLNPSQQDAAGRYCDNAYGVEWGGYIVDNSCYNNLNQAYNVSQTNSVCFSAPPYEKGDCRISYPGERDARGTYCDNAYGVMYQGSIVNNNCYQNLNTVVGLIDSAPYCVSSSPTPPPPSPTPAPTPPPHPGPSLYFNVNGSTHILARPNETLTYNWSTQNLFNIQTYYFGSRGDTCPGGFTQDDFNNHRTKPWVAVNVGESKSLSAQVAPCQSGVSYTIVIKGITLQNIPISAKVIVDVR
jgi:hypothetical protein